MKTTPRQDGDLLLKTAKAIAVELEQRSEGTSLRIKIPYKISPVNTSGWRARIGTMGRGQPRLQIWLDHFAGYEERKFNFCLYSENKSKLRRLAENAPMKKPIQRFITERDMEKKDCWLLSKHLKRAEFNVPIFEQYWGKYFYFGIYDSTVRTKDDSLNRKLCERAAAFFESVARTMPKAKPESETQEVYPKEENRKKVVSHIQRERSRFLANECKSRDEYRCQVCGMHFEDIYGNELGEEFAEAHHRIPLGKLKAEVKTQLDDLATVCANCHRMLHRMDGKYDDVEKLKRIIYQRKR